ncbi:beta-amyrin 16-alpha-hydroxylase CYP87D16-like [Coffea arabica]|uniref:Beta-amyrin 16-alpha-hydroxylase CYP87D16-like n=1 Tax=Coffea arabica TaxID=13443 RepID=A0A6P6SB66_COFAR|nr:cytochrome P450 87A3-like [Coffea arabica]
MLSVVVFVIAVLTILTTQWLWRRMHPRCENGVLPPGSMGLPLIGETLQLLIPSRSLDLHPFIKKRLSKFGPIFRTSLAGRPIVVSADPKVNHFILSQEGKLVELWYLDTFSKLFNQEGDSRTTAVGDIHKYIRSRTLNYLGVEALKEKLLPQLEEMACRTLDSWSNQESVEVKRAFGAMVFNFTAKVFLGYDSDKSSDDLSEKFNKILEGLMSLPLNIPRTAFHDCMKSKKKITGFIKSKLNEKRAGLRTSKEDFLDQAIDDMATEKFLGEDLIVQVMFGLLFASFESNSSTLTLALLKLSQHPSALEMLTSEHETILRNRKRVKSSPTWDEYKSMTFTLQVIHETLRLANVSPGLLRKALKDIQVNGYTIPAGWTILVAASAQQLNPSVFDDALEFNPSRWKDIDKAAIEQNFMPFGAGMRQCAGADYSKVLLSTFLHVLVTKYRWSVVKTGNIGRNPLLSFGDGVYIKIAKKE